MNTTEIIIINKIKHFQFDPIIAIYEVFQEYEDFGAIHSSEEYSNILKKTLQRIQNVCDNVIQMKAE